MKFYRLMPFLAILSFALVFTSCKKDEDNGPAKDSVEAQIVGTWTGSEYYEDGTLSQLNELFGLSSMEFKADGTGSSVSFMGTQAMKWSYDNSTQKLKIITEELVLGEGVTLEADTTENIAITKIDASNLWLSYDDEGTACEEKYTK